MATLTMVRHAQASFGAANYDLLSPLGARQAHILAAFLSKSGAAFHSLFRGNMRRHEMTLEPVIGFLAKGAASPPEPRVSDAFDEFDAAAVWAAYVPDLLREDPGVARWMQAIPQDRRAFQLVFERAALLWISGRHPRPGLVSWESFAERVRGGLRSLMEEHGKGSRVAVFTSAGAIAVAMQTALGLSNEKTLEMAWQVMNASITRFVFGPRGFTLAGFNDVAHLAQAGDPALLTYR
jgi:broad specificity phosphatase PhoE